MEAAIDVRVLARFVVAFGQAGDNDVDARAEAKARRGDALIPVSPNGCSKPTVWLVPASSAKSCSTTAWSAFYHHQQDFS